MNIRKRRLPSVAGSFGAIRFAVIVIAFATAGGRLTGQGASPPVLNLREQIPGPRNDNVVPFFDPLAVPEARTGANHAAWRLEIFDLRLVARDKFGLSGAEYDRPELSWTQSDFVQPQMMIHDRYFFDPISGRYTVDRYLDDLKERYGGIDSVLIWQGYPNIGVDNRNQYDLFHDLPGGVSAIRAMIADFHRRNVLVLFPFYPWDLGTRRIKISDWRAMAEELASVGADGINGDTLYGVPRAFRTASDQLSHPLALEPEGGVDSDEMLNYNNSGWGYWKHEFIPSISREKWLETRHMVHLCERWSRDHTDVLQAAFFNGIGFESWENVWGIWNGITPRDAEALRRIALIERRFSRLLTSPQWVPHAATEQFGVFASEWPGKDAILWTLVNRNQYEVTGPQMAVPAATTVRYFDIWHGTELKPRLLGNRLELSFPLEAKGFGAVLQVEKSSPDLAEFLSRMNRLAARPLAEFSSEWHPLAQTLVDIAPTVPASAPPPGMIQIPAATFLFRVNGVEREGQNFDGTDVQYPWENTARRFHEHLLVIKPFWIDRYPVTNADFKMFLDTAHYQPGDSHNFLRDWAGGAFPPGWARKPVTWVSLQDARAYARWAGKRLPHEWEWQYSAQGTDSRVFPWGDAWNPAAAPQQEDGPDLPPPSEVDRHPIGASPFGVMDLVGNVWQWTDEFADQHTRAAILRGGSHYRPSHAIYYFPQAKMLDQHGKLLLMADSIDRSGTVGFRCVKDAR